MPPVGALLQIARALEIDSGSLLKEPESKLQSRIKAQTKRTEDYAYRTLTPGAENKHESNIEIETWEGDGRVAHWIISGFEVRDAPGWGIDSRGSEGGQSSDLPAQ